MSTHKPNRRDFLRLSAAGVAALSIMNTTEADELSPAPRTPHPHLNEATIAELQTQMRDGKVTSDTLTRQYLERIRDIDPKIRSVIEVNPDALAIAGARDHDRSHGHVRGPLHGIPVLIKDNIDTRDKMHTTAGSLALLEAPTPARDAFVAAQLRAAGAVILGKTNLSEWANFRSTHSTSGWSARGGQTNNPYILDQNPCGSSSGTGAAISASLAAVGVGTETNGSIICPSVTCGLVGIKPTLGLVSRSGIIPISHSQDTAGPMARTVSDAAILLGALVGHDPSDLITEQSTRGHKEYTRYLDENGLKNARIGVARQFFGRNPQVNALLEKHLQLLKDAGATLIDVSFPKMDSFDADENEVLQTEFKADLNAYLATRNSPYRTLESLMRFNDDHKDREMPLFGQEIFLQSQERGGLETESYRLALQRLKMAAGAQGIDAVLEKDKLDALVSLGEDSSWGLAAVAGYPYITVPSGFSRGLPIGLGFFGRAFSEPTLIRFAYAFEQKTHLRQTPRFLPTAT